MTPPDHEYALAMPGPGFGDLQSGVALSAGVAAALYKVARTGEGVVVDVSLMSMGLWGMGMTISGTSVLDTETLPHQYHAESTNPLTNTYRTKDDQFVSLAFLQSDRYWPEFCVLVDKLDWLADERFAEAASRYEHRAALVELLDDLFAEKPLDEWEELLAQQDGQWDVMLPAGRVRHDPQAQANGYVQPVAHDGDGEVVLVPHRRSSTARSRSSDGHRRSASTPTRCSGPRASTSRRSPTCGHAGSSGERSAEVTMRIGLTAYDVHASEFLQLAAAADEAGFSSLWLGEHVVLPFGYTTEHPTTRQPGAQHHTGPIVSPDTELVDPLVQLGAAAAVTRRIELATGIYILPLRHPLAVARAACTVQEIAGGRFVFGLGFGWLEEEFAVLDVPFAERITRFEEAIDVLRAAWRSGEVKHEGRHFSISGVQVTKRVTGVPLMLGGNSERALRRAARLGDGWFSSGTPPFPEAVRLRAELERLRAESERADEPFKLVFRMEGADPDTARRYADEGFEEVLVWTDQVWPAGRNLEDKREAMFAAAEALGVRSSG